MSEHDYDSQAFAGKYLTFKLGDEEFGIEILRVQEIIGLMDIIPVPRTPDFVRGVINLRGKVIPILDQRRSFGMDSTEDHDRKCVIVVQVHHGEARVTMGTVVDEVSEVVEAIADNIEPPPTFGGFINTDYIRGMAKVGDKVVTLLELDAVLSGDELEVIKGTARLPKAGVGR